jgi:hypothetical protein
MTRITSADVGDVSSVSVNDVNRLDYEYAVSNDRMQRSTEPVHIRAADVDAPITDVQREAHVLNGLKGLEERMSFVQAAQLRALLLKYKDCCAVSLRDLPPLKVTPMDIDTGEHKPVRQRIRREPLGTAEWVKDKLGKLFDAGIIVPSHSPWLSPLVVARKPPPEYYRICVDYREVNARTAIESMRMPSVTQLQHGLAKKPWISAIDLKAAYHQLPMAVEARAKTAFGCSLGVFEYTRMPFGLANSPGKYQRCIEELLQPLLQPKQPDKSRFVGCYLDDIAIATETFEAHLELLEQLLTVCRATNLRLGVDKCKFAMPEVPYLGWLCSASGIRPDPEKVRPILEAPTPTTRAMLRSFMGACNYYHRIMPDFAHIATPLRKQLSEKVVYTWTKKCAQTFDKLKHILDEEVTLTHSVAGKSFKLSIDASDYAFGAVLKQANDSHMLRPVAWFSRPFNAHEMNYSVSEKECLAIIAAIKHFEEYLLAASSIEMLTDHCAQALIFNSAKLANARCLARWKNKLMSWRLRVVYRLGALNNVADYMSRYSVQMTAPVVIENGQVVPEAHDNDSPT